MAKAKRGKDNSPGLKIRKEQIRERAWQIYIERIRNHVKGNAYQDWIKAAKELIATSY